MLTFNVMVTARRQWISSALVAM